MKHFKINKEFIKTLESFLLPLTILALGILIFVIFFSGLVFVPKPAEEAVINNNQLLPLAGEGGNQQEAFKNIQAVDPKDNILGDPNAPIKIVMFSDLQCGFCKMFLITMKQIVEEYDGKVALVYRHHPILSDKEGPSYLAAEATECARELGGQNKFWEYLDNFIKARENNREPLRGLFIELAKETGIDSNKFTSCLESGRHSSRIDVQSNDAQRAGARGVPFSVLVLNNEPTSVISGNYPIDEVKRMIDEALRQ